MDKYKKGIVPLMDHMGFGLILLLAICSISVLPLGNGQIMVTTNTLSTVSTYTSTSAVVRNQTSIYSGTFSLPTRAGVCSVYLIPFSAAQGDVLSGSFSANNPVNLYVGMQEPVNNWANSFAACNGPPANILAVPNCNTIPNCTTKASNFTLIMPQTGKWTIAFVGIQADINLNAVLQTNAISTTTVSK
ncbi:MAG TPA: hypothetical protein VJZ03_07305 [Candidatus Bathyarchaeia archaeon]|nr:hypothetical protein [Candidatus Bathyarchaeia archaeon]